MVNEPAGAYGYSTNIQQLYSGYVHSEKKEFLKANLHHSTVELLYSVDWMEDKPFSIYSDSDDDAWIDETEAVQGADIVDDAVIIKDRLAWQRFRK